MTVTRELRSAKEDALNEVEQAMVMASCNDILDSLVTRIPLYTGMRVGELQHMRDTWLNWEKGYIQIPARQHCDCYECKKFRDRIWSPKSKAGIRNLLIVPEIETLLRDAFKKKDFVCRSRQLLEIRFSKVVERSGIQKKCYPHALRATFATKMAERGMSAPSLTYVMGWVSLEPADSYIQSSMKRAHEEQQKILEVE